MKPSIQLRVRAWVARWRRPSRPGPEAPYRVASPPAAPRPRPLSDTLAALQRLWPMRRCIALARTVGVSVAAVVLFSALVRCARFAAPHVSTPVTHLLAIPFGLAVGVVAAVAFLAAGWVVLCLAALSLASAWHVLVGLSRAVIALLTARDHH